nr:MAG: hypothetical protein 2 [Leviviridae sp.]
MKSLMSLWSSVAHEMATRCCTSATRDITTVSSRYEHEGLSFLAITLADYGKAIQKWLDQGHVGPKSDAPAFRWDHRTGFPRFLGGFLTRVFEPSSGVLLDDPDIEAIIALRQLTLMFSKIALPRTGPVKDTASSENGLSVVSARRESKAMSDFIQCEMDVRRSDAELLPKDVEEFCRVSDLLFRKLFTDVDRDVYYMNIFPKHGPGSTADRLTSNGKWNQRTWPSRLERILPYGEFAIPGWKYYDQLAKLDILEPGREQPVRVITVPKTLKTPRIIAIEPTAMQYMQQGLLRSMLDAFRKDNFLSRVIGFSDQEPNRQMAQEGSLYGNLATLDLSEASDRVSNQHVRLMLRNHPHLLEAVDATRSRKADVPGHGVIRLAKYASMGSALCFPFEAMVFTTLAFMGISRELSTPLSRGSDFRRYREQVRVFGDDIIVPQRHVLSVVSRLETFGFQVNRSKSFWTGRFRESCGREYFNGHDVSIVKVRQVFPTRRQDASEVNSLVQLRNQLYNAGYWQTCKWLDVYIGKLLKHFPNVAPTSSLLGRECFLGYQTERMHPYLHSPLVKGYYVKAESPRDPLDGPGALLKCLHRLETRTRQQSYHPSGWFGSDTDSRESVISGLPSADEKHLERSGRPKHVSIKLGWRCPF